MSEEKRNDDVTVEIRTCEGVFINHHSLINDGGFDKLFDDVTRSVGGMRTDDVFER